MGRVRAWHGETGAFTGWCETVGWCYISDPYFSNKFECTFIYPEKTVIQKDACTPMFIAALFTIARMWKQPKCPSTEECIKKKWWDFPGGAVVKNPPANAGDTGSSPGPGRSHMPQSN